MNNEDTPAAAGGQGDRVVVSVDPATGSGSESAMAILEHRGGLPPRLLTPPQVQSAQLNRLLDCFGADPAESDAVRRHVRIRVTPHVSARELRSQAERFSQLRFIELFER